MLAVDVDLDEVYGFADAMAEAVWVADAVGDVGVVVELLDVVGGVPCDRGGVAVVGERGGVDPVLGGVGRGRHGVDKGRGGIGGTVRCVCIGRSST